MCTFSIMAWFPQVLETWKSPGISKIHSRPGKVEEFGQICPNVLENGHRSLKISFVKTFIPELVNLWHYKCWKYCEYWKNEPKWTWKMHFGPGKVLAFCDGNCVGTMSWMKCNLGGYRLLQWITLFRRERANVHFQYHAMDEMPH